MGAPEAIPPVIGPEPGRARGWLWAGAVALAVLGLLYGFNPAEHGFYPRCVFHQLTGLDCPGCGGLRAAHQLLHGHFRAAFALNPLLCVLAPVLGWFVGRQVWRRVTGRELANPFRHPGWVWVLVVALVIFGVLRNLPPFRHLGPS